jgi:hypothetical protein
MAVLRCSTCVRTKSQRGNDPKGAMLEILKEIHESTFKGHTCRKRNARESDSVYAMGAYCSLKSIGNSSDAPFCRNRWITRSFGLRSLWFKNPP